MKLELRHIEWFCHTKGSKIRFDRIIKKRKDSIQIHKNIFDNNSWKRLLFEMRL